MQPDRLRRIRHEGQIGCGCRACTHHNHVREQGRFRIHRVREVRVPGDRHPDRPLPRREHRPVHVRPAPHRPHAGHLQHHADVHLLRQVPGAPDRPVQVRLHQQVQVRAGGSGARHRSGGLYALRLRHQPAGLRLPVPVQHRGHHVPALHRGHQVAARFPRGQRHRRCFTRVGKTSWWIWAMRSSPACAENAPPRT